MTSFRPAGRNIWPILRRPRPLQLGLIAGLSVYLLMAAASPAYAMHIAEGFLPWPWALFWWLVALPFLGWGWLGLRKITHTHPELKPLLALVAAFTFVLSALKLPSVTGSSSHPTGIGLGAILFGPGVMSILGGMVLLFQALLLAHGGLTTLGANLVSMAIVGPGVASGVYYLMMGRRHTPQSSQSAGKMRQKLAIFWAAALADLATYLATSGQLALAFPAAQGGVMAAFLKFASIFAITQVPLAISEGLLTVLVWNWLQAYGRPELETLKVLQPEL